MKKIFSMFLIFIMVLPSFLVNAAEDSCLIEFSGSTPTYSISGTQAFISGHYGEDAKTDTISGKTGWVLNPTSDKTAYGYGYDTIRINLADNFMNLLSGTQDVLVDVCYYDGTASDKGSKFCVNYDSKNHHEENAGIIELAGSGEWKTQTFVLEKPRLKDIGNYPSLWNIAVSVTSPYMGTSEGEVVIGSAEIYYGEQRELFFELDSENVGNIFFNGEPVELNMILENPYAVQHDELTAKFTLTSQIDGSVYQAEKTIAVGDAENLTQTINLDDLNLPFGIYNVSAEIYNDDALVVSDETEISCISAMGTDNISVGGLNNSFLGFNTHATLYSSSAVKDVVHLAARSGVGFIRDTFGWDALEKTAGEYQVPETFRTFLEQAKEKGLKVMVVLGNSNTLAYPDYKPWRTDSTEENFQMYLTKYSDYVEYIVTEFKDYVECWEIYNEYGLDYPNYDKSDDTMALEAAKDYSDILKAGYAAVKRADPDAYVVGGALDGNVSKENFAGRLYDTFGAADYMDALSFHSYCSYSDTSGEIDTLNGDKALFNGYIDTYKPGQKLYLDEFNFTAVQGLTMEEQALYNVRFLTKERYLGEMDRIYSYCLESKSYNLGSGYGFVERPEDDYDYLVKTSAARPNYAALAFMNKLLRLSDSINFTEDENGNYIYEFYDNINERPVYVIWNKNNTVSNASIIDPGTELTAYDMYGNEISNSLGSLNVTTGKKPVYVAGPEKDFLVGQDDETYKVSISGRGTSGNSISIVVLNKGTQEFEFSSVNQILYTNQKQIDSEGNWGFTFKITQGNGEYEVLLAEETGITYNYTLNYNAGNLTVGYELMQQQGGVYNFASLSDGNLNINYRIDNPDNEETGFNIFGCLYMGDKLVKVVKSEDSKLAETDLIKTGSITIPNVKKSEIDKVQIMIFDDTDNIKPLYPKFVLE